MSLVSANSTLQRPNVSNNDIPNQFCSRTSSGLPVGGSRLYPVTEMENEPAALSSKQPNNANKLAALKRRSYAVNALYKNIMNKRKSTGISTIEHNLNGSAPTDSKGNPRDDLRGINSISNVASSINLTINTSDVHGQKTRNPIDHYEQNMNFALRPQSSSTIDFVAAVQPKLSERSRSDTYLKYSTVRSRDLEAKSDGLRLDSCGEKEEGEHLERDAFLCDEIADALKENIFHKEITFDNKWFDNTAFQNFADRMSQTSSNQSPLTKISKVIQPSSDISRRDSIILEEFEKDLKTISNRKNGSSENASSSNSSRLQLKLNTMKMKYDSVQDGFDALSDCTTAVPNDLSDCLGSRLSNLQGKYWNVNLDVKTKLLSEKISRELKAVKRTATDDSHISGNLLSSKLKKFVKEKQLGEGLSSQKSPSQECPQPFLKTFSGSHSDEVFSELFENTKRGRNEIDQFQKKVSQVFSDVNLKETILAARDHSCKIWLEAEKLEFS